MISRRSLLLGAGTLALSQGIMGCRLSRQAALQVQLLQGSVPAQLLKAFQRTLPQRPTLKFLPSPQLAELFDQLKTWKPSTSASPERPRRFPSLRFFNTQPLPVADWVTLADYWLAPAIQQGLIQPLALEAVPQWQAVPQPWQAVVRRDAAGQVAAEGQIWAAPYRWGTVVIAYNVERMRSLGWVPTDWRDLWRPELRGHISLLDSDRIVIGLTLKQLGASINSNNLADIPDLAATLQALHQQTKLYTSDAYLQPLLLEDTWVAVGWSTDVLPVAERDPRIAAVVPASGTLLTADVWVRPAAATPLSFNGDLNEAELPAKWIDFCWQAQPALQLSLLSSAASPIIALQPRETLPPTLQQQSLVLPAVDVVQRSEFLYPLSSDVAQAYEQLWLKIRQAS